MNDTIFTVDSREIVTYINASIEQVLGYTPDEIIGRTFRVLFHPEDLPHGLQVFKKAMSGTPDKATFRIISKTGEIKWAHFSIQPVYKKEKVIGLQGIATDITQTKLLQNQLIRSERLAATGQLAASITHEINSPLQGITAILDFLKKDRVQDRSFRKT